MQPSAKIQPNWDMTPYFPDIEGEVYHEFFSELSRELAALGARSADLPPIEVDTVGDWAAFLASWEAASSRLGHVSSYLGCLGAADARSDAIRGETARLAWLRAAQEKIWAMASHRFGEASREAFEVLVGQPDLEGMGYRLRRARQGARKSMAPELEGLAADLKVTGLGAWARLYDQISGTLTFELAVPGQPVRELPVSMTRSLLEDRDPEVRRAALTGANVAWSRHADSLAACLNNISGSRLTVYRRRGEEHYLDPALFGAAIERKTLNTMMEVVTTAQPLVRRYLWNKARLLGKERLGFQDLKAPVGKGDGEGRSWGEGVALLFEAFEAFHPELADFARHAVEHRWIDYEPRLGKRPGAFCSSSSLINQSRIFLSYHGKPGDLLTLSHELGHGFHNWVMRDLRPWARGYPMTLAETASTFCEQVVTDLLLERAASVGERLGVLDERLQDAATFLLNIPMRFWFESALYDERRDGEVGVHRLQEMMLDAQRRAYGDALDPDELDPWFWASKLHFYISSVSFYNFPYTFGYLFSFGLFARALKEGRGFLPRYKALLRETGGATAEEVAARNLGVDLRAPAFWEECIGLIQADCAAFEDLVNSVLGPQNEVRTAHFHR